MTAKQMIWAAWRRDFEPKLISSLRKGYSLSIFKKDFFAGVTVAIVSFPLAMALAVASGATPYMGLFSAVIAGFITAILGGGRTQIGGPASAFVVVIYDVIAHHGYDGLILATIMAGIMLVIAGIARLGSIIKYIPYSVIVGFTSGLAVVIFSGQLKDFFGLGMTDLPNLFVDKIKAYSENYQTFDTTTTIIGFVVLAAILYIRKYYPRIPVLLVVVSVASLIVWYWGMDVATISSKFGELPRGLPYPTLPNFSIEKMIALLPAASTIAFLAGVEALLCAVISDGMTGERHRSNAELVGQGVANIITPLFGGLPSTAAFSRTATNIKSGAKTPISGIVQSLVILFFMLVLNRFAGMIPLVALAAILVIVAFDMFEAHRFMRILRGPKGDALLVIVTFVLTIVANLTVAIQAGIVLAALLFVQRMSRLTQITPITPHGHNDHSEQLSEGNIFEHNLPEGVCMYHINGPFFFGAASRLRFILDQVAAETKVYILNFINVPMIDATGAQVIRQFTEKCHKKDVSVILCGLNAHSRESLTGIGMSKWVPHEQRVSTLNAAIELAQKIIIEQHSPLEDVIIEGQPVHTETKITKEIERRPLRN